MKSYVFYRFKRKTRWRWLVGHIVERFNCLAIGSLLDSICDKIHCLTDKSDKLWSSIESFVAMKLVAAVNTSSRNKFSHDKKLCVINLRSDLATSWINFLIELLVKPSTHASRVCSLFCLVTHSPPNDYVYFLLSSSYAKWGDSRSNNNFFSLWLIFSATDKLRLGRRVFLELLATSNRNRKMVWCFLLIMKGAIKEIS